MPSYRWSCLQSTDTEREWEMFKMGWVHFSLMPEIWTPSKSPQLFQRNGSSAFHAIQTKRLLWLRPQADGSGGGGGGAGRCHCHSPNKSWDVTSFHGLRALRSRVTIWFLILFTGCRVLGSPLLLLLLLPFRLQRVCCYLYKQAVCQLINNSDSTPSCPTAIVVQPFTRLNFDSLSININQASQAKSSSCNNLVHAA